MSDRKSGRVQSVSRALAILSRLGEFDDGLTLSQLSKDLKLAPSTAHRLLTTLQEERFVHFNDTKGFWQVGVQAFVVGSHFLGSRDLVTVALPYMEQLMEQSGETTNLAMADRGEIVYLAQVQCHQLMRTLARPGARVAMHCSAVGKALLSQMSENDVARVLRNRGLPRVTDQTITSMDELCMQLRTARQRGYAMDDEEHSIGLRCIAAPVFDERGTALAAVSLSGPKVRLPEARVEELATLLVETGRQITQAYGGIIH
ncbi:MAG: IclR family transcriptional regulator C-terminal domain-containing protein [Rhodospirillaceae bacterium]